MAVTLELPKELEDRLDMLSEVTERTCEDYLPAALAHYLEELKDYNDIIFPSLNPEVKNRTAEETTRDLGGVEDD